MKERASPDASDVRFTGDIPLSYDRYLGPLLFEPFAVDLARRVAKLKPRNLLEIAAGTGIVSRRLLEVLPPASRFTVTDLNEPMLAVAREKVGRDPRVTLGEADALDLHFPDGEFDVVACQFGVMFFPDKSTALREMHRVLTVGGTLLISTWDSLAHNQHAAIAHGVTSEIFDVDPPAFYEVPFGFNDVDDIRRVVQSAGFRRVEIETIELTGESPSAADAAIGFVRGNPTINLIMERAPDRLEEIERMTAERLADRYGDEPLRIPLRAHVVTAKRDHIAEMSAQSLNR